MQWPQFRAILNEKFYRNYGYTVYLPLLKRKKMEIYEKNMRADYHRCLHVWLSNLRSDQTPVGKTPQLCGHIEFSKIQFIKKITYLKLPIMYSILTFL